MKKLALLFTLTLFGGLLFYYNTSLDQNKKTTNNKLAKKGQPYDFFNFQRAYPNEFVDLKKVDKAYTSALLDQLNKSNDNTPWTQQGPKNIGGRLNCVTIDPQNTNIIYVGSSAGGIFRSLDDGATWSSIANDLDFLPISSIVLDPTNSNIIYVGTGDHNITGIPHIGNGIYKSIDGGTTWQNMGLNSQRIVSRIVINPQNTQILYAATMGLPFQRNDERGLYKSIDGGANWDQVLFVTDEAGIIDVVMDPTRPDTIFAASWNRIRNNSESVVYGKDAHIYRSYDGGSNWTIVEQNLPMENGDAVSRIGLEMSGQNPGKVYSIVVDTNFQLGALASLNVGTDAWDTISIDMDQMSNALGGFGWYFGQIRVNPTDDNEISVLGVDLYSTFDGGSSWFRSSPPWWEYTVHADKHDLQYANGNIFLATDGGLYTADESFTNWQDKDYIPNTQFYRLAINPHNPGYFTGGAQDNGTTTGKAGEDWSRDRGGDGFQAIFDPIDPTLSYAETQNGGLAYTYEGDGFWTGCSFGIEPVEKKNWDMPWIMSSHDHTVLYTGAQSAYQMTNAPMGNWHPISEDLTSGLSSGGRQHTISSVAESPLDEDILYVGETGGKVWRTLDQGENWTLISTDLPLRYVTNIKVSPFEANTVFVTLSGFKDNDNEAHIYKSTDNGDSWVNVSGDMGDFPVNHLEILNDSSLIVATDVGVYSTANFGLNWTRVGNNMPVFPVFDIEIDTAQNVLVAGTFARSIMTFPIDSLTTAPVATGTPQPITEKIAVYPNPAKDFIRPTIKGTYTYSIFDLSGKQVLSTTNGYDQNNIDIQALTPGIYFLNIKIANKLKIGKFLKK